MVAATAGAAQQLAPVALLLPGALLGGAAMIAVGAISMEDAYRVINFDTITLLLGMMIVVANLRVSGFFRVITDWIATYVRHPLALLRELSHV